VTLNRRNARRDAAPRAKQLREFRAAVLRWGRRHGRSFHWRSSKLDDYEMLVTEILLARTRAENVEPVVRLLVQTYPDATALATADVRHVESVLFPLGLSRKRATALVAMATALVQRHGGTVPHDLDQLLALPYVGRYAANAFLCFGGGRRVSIVDANVARLLSRYWGLPEFKGKLELAHEYWDVARELMPAREGRLFNWTLLDLGALICTPRNPRCEICPLSRGCRARNIRPGRERAAKLGALEEP
jgi:A/G-specific adenine glycosylase